MNYLQLVQRTLLLLRASNDKVSDPPTSFEDLDGINYEVMQWIAASVLDIQNWKNSWNFMRKPAEIVVQGGSRVVNLRGSITDLNFLIPSTGDNDNPFITSYTDEQRAEIKCYYVPWEAWRGSVYDRSPRSDSSQPIRFTIRPDQQLVLDPGPSQPITLVFDYQCTAVDLVDETSLPVIPPQYAMAIVYWAIVNYYCVTRDKTAEFNRKAQAQLDRELTRLKNDQLPAVTYGGYST